MNINITADLCKKIIDNPSNTEMERILAAYALRLHARIGKVENDCNDYKNILKSIAAKFFSQCPWILEQESKNHNITVTQNENKDETLKDAV